MSNYHYLGGNAVYYDGDEEWSVVKHLESLGEEERQGLFDEAYKYGPKKFYLGQKTFYLSYDPDTKSYHISTEPEKEE